MPERAHGVQTLMAFDFGEKRIGVALGNSLSGGARPLTVIEEERRDERFQAISALIQEWKPDRLVVGLPAYPDGAAHPFGERCRRFANQLSGRFGLPVILADERYTSALAPKDIAVDAAAAAILLQSVLDTLASHAPIDPA